MEVEKVEVRVDCGAPLFCWHSSLRPQVPLKGEGEGEVEVEVEVKS